MNDTMGTNSTETRSLDEEKAILAALTEAEIVIIGAVGAVVLLASLAVLLRLIMPTLRSRGAKEKTVEATSTSAPSLATTPGKLLPPGTPSSQRSNASSGSSIHGNWSDTDSYKNKSMFHSQNNLYPGRVSSFGNLRQQAVLNSANASPASYRSKTKERLNEDLISMISQGSLASLGSFRSQQSLISKSSGLEPLDLADQYRCNWQTRMQPSAPFTNEAYNYEAPVVVVDNNELNEQESQRHNIPTIVYPEQTKL